MKYLLILPTHIHLIQNEKWFDKEAIRYDNGFYPEKHLQGAYFVPEWRIMEFNTDRILGITETNGVADMSDGTYLSEAYKRKLQDPNWIEKYEPSRLDKYKA
jgi:hypothetical protein